MKPVVLYSEMEWCDWMTYTVKDVEEKMIDLADWFLEHRALYSILKELESVKAAVTEIYDKKLYGIGQP